MSPLPGILFTAFEPSGDAHAAPVIAALRRLRPDVPIYAWGGPKMAAAGADLIETTTEHAVMLAGAIAKAREHWDRVGRIRAWLAHNPIAALVPVDSPAANWAICKAVRKQQPNTKIIHLVAPQLWAWAPWRIRKLRRLTDHVLCLLPFEPEWFGSRGVSATFVGHPLYETPRSLSQRVFERPGEGDEERSDESGEGSHGVNSRSLLQGDLAIPHPGPLPKGEGVRLALLPGSRPGEWRANWPTMVAVHEQLRRRHPTLITHVAAIDDAAVEALRKKSPMLDTAAFIVGRADEVLDWADVVLVVSGTAVLQTAAHRKPLVAIYNVNRWTWNLVGRWLVKTRTFTLPNLIAESQGWGRVTPELVPHFGQVKPAVAAVDALITDAAVRQRQVEAFDRIADLFAGKHYAEESAALILRESSLSSSPAH